MDEFDNEEYVDDNTELNLDDDYNPSELDDDYVWHPAMQDGFNIEFAS